jgi:hypothetical protein
MDDDFITNQPENIELIVTLHLSNGPLYRLREDARCI